MYQMEDACRVGAHHAVLDLIDETFFSGTVGVGNLHTRRDIYEVVNYLMLELVDTSSVSTKEGSTSIA